MSVRLLIEKRLEATLQSKNSAPETEVGLLIGTLKPRLFILDCIHTPEVDPGVPLEQKIREDLLDHGCLVNRIIPAGIEIVGVYFCFSQPQKQQLLPSLKKCLQKICNDRLVENEDDMKRVIVQFVTGTANVSTSLVKVPAKTSTEDQECHFTFREAVESITIYCKYPLDVDVPVSEKTPSIRTVRQLILASEAATQKEMCFTVGGGEILENQKIKDLVGNGRVELKPWSTIGSTAAIPEASMKGNVVVRGVMDCRALCPTESSAMDVISLIKLDALRSIKTRLQIMKESEEENQLGTTFPRRVWTRWKSNAYLCEYVNEDEGLEDVEQSIDELMHFQIQTIDDLESLPALETVAGAPERKRGMTSPYWLHISMGILAIVVGMAMYFFY